MIGFALKELGLIRIEAGYFIVNEASGNVLKKLNFTQKGTSLRECMAQKKKLNHAELELMSKDFNT